MCYVTYHNYNNILQFRYNTLYNIFPQLLQNVWNELVLLNEKNN